MHNMLIYLIHLTYILLVLIKNSLIKYPWKKNYDYCLQALSTSCKYRRWYFMFINATESKLCNKQQSKIKKKPQNICLVHFLIKIINLINLPMLLYNWITLSTLKDLLCTFTFTASLYSLQWLTVTDFFLILQVYHDFVRDHLIKIFIKSAKKHITLVLPNWQFILENILENFSHYKPRFQIINSLHFRMD